MEALILSCSTGGGHNSAGYAIRDELERRGHSVKMFDPYQLVENRHLDKKIGELYVKTVRHTPWFFGCLYKMGEAYSKTSLKSPVFLANEKMEEPLERYLKSHNFDVIIMTHLFPGQMITHLKNKGVKLPKTIYIATDYTCIPFTEEIDADKYVIPTEKLTLEFVSKGLDQKRIVPLGIPVKDAFSNNEKPKDKNNGRKYLLLSSGSIGLTKLEDAVKILLSYLQSNQDCDLIVICGGNKRLMGRLFSKFKDNPQLKLILKTEHMADYIKGCDVFITKPGGLSSTEAAVAGVPIIHILPIPGCESCNIRLFDGLGLSIGVGNRLKNLPLALDSLKTQEEKNSMVKAQHKEINQNSTKDICDLAESLIK